MEIGNFNLGFNSITRIKPTKTEDLSNELSKSLVDALDENKDGVISNNEYLKSFDPNSDIYKQIQNFVPNNIGNHTQSESSYSHSGSRTIRNADGTEESHSYEYKYDSKEENGKVIEHEYEEKDGKILKQTTTETTSAEVNKLLGNSFSLGGDYLQSLGISDNQLAKNIWNSLYQDFSNGNFDKININELNVGVVNDYVKEHFGIDISNDTDVSNGVITALTELAKNSGDGNSLTIDNFNVPIIAHSIVSKGSDSSKINENFNKAMETIKQMQTGLNNNDELMTMLSDVINSVGNGENWSGDSIQSLFDVIKQNHEDIIQKVKDRAVQNNSSETINQDNNDIEKESNIPEFKTPIKALKETALADIKQILEKNNINNKIDQTIVNSYNFGGDYLQTLGISDNQLAKNIWNSLYQDFTNGNFDKININELNVGVVNDYVKEHFDIDISNDTDVSNGVITALTKLAKNSGEDDNTLTIKNFNTPIVAYSLLSKNGDSSEITTENLNDVMKQVKNIWNSKSPGAITLNLYQTLNTSDNLKGTWARNEVDSLVNTILKYTNTIN